MRRAALCLTAVLLLTVLSVRLSAAVVFIAGDSEGSLNNETVDSDAINSTGATISCIGEAYLLGPATPTDNMGNTYVGLTAAGSAPGFRWYCDETATGGMGHVASWTGTLGDAPCIVHLTFSGTLGAMSLDQQNGGTDTDSTIQAGSVTPSTNGQVVITGINAYDQNAVSIDGGFTIPTGGETDFNSGLSVGCGAAYLIQTTATAANPTWTITGSPSADFATAAAATFKASVAAGGLSRRLLLGCC